MQFSDRSKHFGDVESCVLLTKATTVVEKGAEVTTWDEFLKEE
jgi:hypothetical protein